MLVMPVSAHMAAEMHTDDVGASEGQIRVVDLESCDLLLMVSNQSYLDDPVVLTVVIDGVDVVSQPFEVRNQHHFVRFPLRLGPGPHQLKVSSDTGVVLEEQFTLPATGERQHAGIGYYNYADEDGKLIDWNIPSMPIGIK
jgi:hypothetical protein